MPNQESKSRPALLKMLPSITEILTHSVVAAIHMKYPERYIHQCARRVVEDTRQDILQGVITDAEHFPRIEQLAARCVKLVQTGLENRLLRAINGTGVILHTGLGRAPLSNSARKALIEAAARYCLLAVDRDTGRRGDRHIHCDELLCELTGAESSLVVNNNSAAVMLALNTFGAGREAIVSRGELVEIGGSFRVPDVMKRSGTIMVEVGTTNKTHLRDYREAITDATSVLLKVHTSNYRIEGFHQEVGIRELSALARERNLIVVMDIGSGALVDIRRWGLPYEPTVPEAVADGADVVTFSGDKMLGGPQSGIIVGRRELIDRMKKNPLMRALRCDKLIIAALFGTLRLFLEPDDLPQNHPVYRMLSEPQEIVQRRASRLARRLKATAGEALKLRITGGTTEMGSGSLPARGIPSRVVIVTSNRFKPDELARRLRQAYPPVFTRVEENSVIIDARTVADEEISLIVEAFKQALGAGL
ncbi:MAG: L-seryl-tRNA(Sec) selenium transferase [Calditrichota bacterium]